MATVSVDLKDPQVQESVKVKLKKEVRKGVGQGVGGGRPIRYSEERAIKKAKEYIAEFTLSGELPSLAGLSVFMDLNKETVLIYRKKYKKFSALIKKIQTLQEQKLLKDGYIADKPAFHIFLLKTKHKYVEKSGLDLTTKGQSLNININKIVPEKK